MPDLSSMGRVVGCGWRLVFLLAPVLGCAARPAPSCGAARAGARVQPPPRRAANAWPDEPAGLALITDEGFHRVTENGWRVAQRQRINGSGISLVTDSTAPFSPPDVLQFTYAPGFVGGSEPGAEFYDAPAPQRDTYVGLWWKPSNPWQNHDDSGVNKIAFLYTADGSTIVLIMFHDTAGYTLQVVPEFRGDTRRLAPNVTATPVTLGVWHQIEWHVKYASSGALKDGVTEWWLDGVLQGKYSDLQTPPDAGFHEYQLAPTWGGVGGTKIEADCYWYDHAHISGSP